MGRSAVGQVAWEVASASCQSSREIRLLGRALGPHEIAAVATALEVIRLVPAMPVPGHRGDSHLGRWSVKGVRAARNRQPEHYNAVFLLRGEGAEFGPTRPVHITIAINIQG